MSYLTILTSKAHNYPDDVIYTNPEDSNKGVMGVAGQMQIVSSTGANLDILNVTLVDSSGTELSLGGGGGGGGNNIWSNAKGDFTATITNATKNITIAGLDGWTFDWKHVKLGSIWRKNAAGLTELVENTTISVSSGVITLADEDSNFVTGDEVVVELYGPDKAYQQDDDSVRVFVSNPDHANNTSPEPLVAESNMGIDGAFDGATGATAFFTDTGETFTPASVAEGYKIYNVSDTGPSYAVVNADTLEGLAGDGGAGAPSADDINHTAGLLGATHTGPTANTWQPADVASIPEVKRFVLPATNFPFPTFDILIDSQDAYNSCYVKVYATNFEEADDTDDIYWSDMTEQLFDGVTTITADGIGDAARAVTKAIAAVDTKHSFLKWMVKIVAECSNGTQNNEFKVRIIKS